MTGAEGPTSFYPDSAVGQLPGKSTRGGYGRLPKGQSYAIGTPDGSAGRRGVGLGNLGAGRTAPESGGIQ